MPDFWRLPEIPGDLPGLLGGGGVIGGYKFKHLDNLPNDWTAALLRREGNLYITWDELKCCCNCIYVYLYMDNSLELDLIDVLQLILYNVPLFVYWILCDEFFCIIINHLSMLNSAFYYFKMLLHSVTWTLWCTYIVKCSRWQHWLPSNIQLVTL